VLDQFPSILNYEILFPLETLSEKERKFRIRLTLNHVPYVFNLLILIKSKYTVIILGKYGIDFKYTYV